MAIQYESKARANMKYRATHLKRFAFDVNKSTQPKLFDYIESVNNVQGYIRNLIYEDMKKQGKEID